MIEQQLARSVAVVLAALVAAVSGMGSADAAVGYDAPGLVYDVAVHGALPGDYLPGLEQEASPSASLTSAEGPAVSLRPSSEQVAPRTAGVVDDLGRQVSGFGGSLDNIAVPDAVRIQNAADRIGHPISVIGGRAKGTSDAFADWDYVITGINSRTKHSVSSSLPAGPRGLGERRKLDVFTGPLATDEAFVTFYPSSAG